MRPSSSLPPPGALEKRAILLGVVTSTFLAIAIVIAGLKAGITPGVSPLVVLFAWAVFARALRHNHAHVILNQAQVAGSAGAAVSAGVIFTAPLLPILSDAQGLPYHGLPLLKLMGASVAGALIGYGYVGLNARRVLADPTLPAPEARACEAMVRVATDHVEDVSPASANEKPRLRASLVPGMLHGFFASVLTTIGLASAQLRVLSLNFGSSDRSVDLQLPYMPLYFGIGGLLQLGTAFAVFLGAILRLVFDVGLAASNSATLHWPDTSLRWIGGGAMSVAVLWSLLSLAQKTRTNHAPTASEFHPNTLSFSARVRRLLRLNILLGALLLLGGIVVLSGWSWFSITLATAVTLLAAFMVALGALLSLQIGSSASPVSGAIFLMTLILCAIALAAGRGQNAADLELMTLVLVAACVAVCTSNDTSQDYRTLQLCDVPISRGFKGQWLGLMVAAIVVPITIVLAEQAYGLGTPALPAPQGQLFATLAEGMLFERALPWTPILVGAAVGSLAVALEVIGKRKGLWMPAMALAVGLYLPPELGVGLVLGAGARWLGDRGKHERSASVLTAGGLITGAAAFDLVFGIAMLAGVSASALQLFTLPAWLQHLAAVLGIASILWLIYQRARGRQTA